MTIPSFKTKSEAFKWLADNKEIILANKTNTIKNSDVLEYYAEKSNTTTIEKASVTDINSLTSLSVRAVINSCGIIDSHKDCHIEGIWKKSLSENKAWYWLQEHRMQFDHIIADSKSNEIKAYTEQVPYKQLGIKGQGATECLVFEGDLDRRNEYMFKQYAKGYIFNHSVGMRYIKIFMCVNSDESVWKEEKDNWDKYYPMVINKDIANADGYFWAVTEAKFIEGSAVVIGSNQNTPTLEVDANKNIEPSNDTQDDNHINEPLKNTQKEKSFKLNQFL